jgi:hypothetical protein
MLVLEVVNYMETNAHNGQGSIKVTTVKVPISSDNVESNLFEEIRILFVS